MVQDLAVPERLSENSNHYETHRTVSERNRHLPGTVNLLQFTTAFTASIETLIELKICPLLPLNFRDFISKLSGANNLIIVPTMQSGISIFKMADGVVPVQAKILVQEIVKIEFEIQNVVQEIRHCKGPLSSLNSLNFQVKKKLVSLREKVEVGCDDVPDVYM